MGAERGESRPVPETGSKNHYEQLEALMAELAKPVTPILVDLALSKGGVLQDLEEIGLVPKLENPNPFDIDSNEEAHEKWWNDHPDVAKQFERTYQLREQVLIVLYAGAVLRNFLRLEKLPENSGRTLV